MERQWARPINAMSGRVPQRDFEMSKRANNGKKPRLASSTMMAKMVLEQADERLATGVKWQRVVNIDSN